MGKRKGNPPVAAPADSDDDAPEEVVSVRLGFGMDDIRLG